MDPSSLDLTVTDDMRRVPEHGVAGLGPAAWAEACRRAAVIAPLATLDRVGAPAARAAGERLGLSERTIYALVRRYRASGRVAGALVPRGSAGGRGKPRLTTAAERIIEQAIRDEYLTRQKKRVEAVVRAVRERCRSDGVRPPSANTVRSRVRRVRADLAASRREGARSAGARRLAAAAGVTPEAAQPMEVLQMDHTPVDLITVDEEHRRPVGRPWLTVAIDVGSRCIAGLHLSYEPPSATGVGLCLAHAALDKDAYLRRLGLEPTAWPVHGKPGGLYVDNAAEFHSEALERGCEQHGIKLDFRPVGQPHYGGVVERLIGTLMRTVHELPGTTFSNPAERGRYDSDAAACFTLAELERWLVLAITGPYHHGVHDGIGMPPIALWRDNVAAHGPPPAVSNPHAFLLDFLPAVRRRITREGFVVDHIAYFSDALRPWIAERDGLGRFLIRRDPRDLTRVWALDPAGRFYVEVPCSRQGRPRISLFEHRQAVAAIRSEGRARVDEDAIFRAVEAQRETARAAAASTRSARRRLARVAPQAPATTSPAPPSPVREPEDLAWAAAPFPMERWR